MEYVIGTVQRGNDVRMILKTKSDVHTDFKGRMTLEQKKGNTFIRDTFTIIQKYQTGDSSDGYVYDWYYIDGHSRQEDRSEEVKAQVEEEVSKAQAMIDYIAKMSDVDHDEIAEEE